MSGCALGVDTSAYTTSLALVSLAGDLLWEERRPLPVAPGRRGLRQSEAVFEHLRVLPALFEAGFGRTTGSRLRVVAASTAPRPVRGSYMPVFRAGEGFARAVAAVLGVPFVGLSHQEGHIWAGLWAAGGPAGDRFLALHASGGTTEVLLVRREGAGRLAVERLGRGLDLHAGQFVDRVGVTLGLPFPAGPHLEALAAAGRPGAVRLPVAVQGADVSFSGPATAALRALSAGSAPSDLAWAVQECLARSLLAIVAEGVRRGGPLEVLAVGGVLANRRVRAVLADGLAGVPVFFADPSHSVDNAVGVAVAAARSLLAGGPPPE